MTITYVVENGLYINMTNRCTNRCDFCIRKNGDGAYGSDSLWLEREPSKEEVWEAIVAAEPTSYCEIVFCGYGEPTCRLDDMLWVCGQIRATYPALKIRLNTNGHASLIYGEDVASRFAGCFDTVSISLNAPSAEEYDAICHSKYGLAAFDGMFSFAKAVKPYVPCVMFSVVRQFLSQTALEECRRLCDTVGVTLKIREYIS
ncbi:MAG: radical SAM protein [Clostridia bacterium]|nr:radical SAM protein [Clostridia bacterium]